MQNPELKPPESSKPKPPEEFNPWTWVFVGLGALVVIHTVPAWVAGVGITAALAAGARKI